MRTELDVRVEIQQLEELEVFNALRLSVEVLAEVLPKVLADVAADIAGRTELVRTELVQAKLKAQIEIQRPEELKVLLMAVRYWDSLKS